MTKKFIGISIVFVLFFCCKEQNSFDNEKVNAEVTTESYRPQYHFTPKTSWMNDPNGLVYHNDNYHLFYQYYPDSTVWGPMHWGHAKSKDLLHWKHEPKHLAGNGLG